MFMFRRSISISDFFQFFTNFQFASGSLSANLVRSDGGNSQHNVPQSEMKNTLVFGALFATASSEAHGDVVRVQPCSRRVGVNFFQPENLTRPRCTARRRTGLSRSKRVAGLVSAHNGPTSAGAHAAGLHSSSSATL
jgi:hypothetical protein